MKKLILMSTMFCATFVSQFCFSAEMGPQDRMGRPIDQTSPADDRTDQNRMDSTRDGYTFRGNDRGNPQHDYYSNQGYYGGRAYGDNYNYATGSDSYGAGYGSGYGSGGYYGSSGYSAGGCGAGGCAAPVADSGYQGQVEQQQQPCDQATGECWCMYCHYEPCYTNCWRCIEVPQYCTKKCCRQVPQYYQVQRCRYVPQYYCETCCRNVPEYYDVQECKMCKKWICDKKCNYVPKYYYKKVCCNTNACTPQ